MLRFSIVICLFFLSCAELHSQTSTYVKEGQKHTVAWDDFVDQIVTVDGLAWGAHAKGLGQHVVLPAGRVYVRGIDYSKHDLNGRLLRISGFLRKLRVEKAPPNVQGYGETFDYYVLESLEVARIDKIQFDQLLPSTFAWIVVGAETDAALRTIGRLEFQKYTLALTGSDDGSTPHSYQITESEVLLFSDLNGRIKSITKIQLNDPSKRVDDQWIPVKAYRLPSK